MKSRTRLALVAAGMLTALPATAQYVMSYLFDRLDQPVYARAWSNMLASQNDLPYWLVDHAKRATQGAGRRVIVEQQDAETYSACEPHNCTDSRFVVLFIDQGAQAKGSLIIAGSAPRFFGHPDPAEAAALLDGAK